MYNIENMFMADHLDKHHVFCQQNPFANSNVALQWKMAYHPDYKIGANFSEWMGHLSKIHLALLLG